MSLPCRQHTLPSLQASARLPLPPTLQMASETVLPPGRPPWAHPHTDRGPVWRLIMQPPHSADSDRVSEAPRSRTAQPDLCTRPSLDRLCRAPTVGRAPCVSASANWQGWPGPLQGSAPASLSWVSMLVVDGARSGGPGTPAITTAESCSSSPPGPQGTPELGPAPVTRLRRAQGEMCCPPERRRRVRNTRLPSTAPRAESRPEPTPGWDPPATRRGRRPSETQTPRARLGRLRPCSHARGASTAPSAGAGGPGAASGPGGVDTRVGHSG